MMVGQLSTSLSTSPVLRRGSSRGRPTGSHGTGLARGVGFWALGMMEGWGRLGQQQARARARPWGRAGRYQARQGRIRRGCDLFHPQSGRPSRRFRFPNVVARSRCGVCPGGCVFRRGNFDASSLPKLAPTSFQAAAAGGRAQAAGPCARLAQVAASDPCNAIGRSRGTAAGRSMRPSCLPWACP